MHISIVVFDEVERTSLIPVLFDADMVMSVVKTVVSLSGVMSAEREDGWISSKPLATRRGIVEIIKKSALAAGNKIEKAFDFKNHL